jgi:hypothetical protein
MIFMVLLYHSGGPGVLPSLYRNEYPNQKNKKADKLTAM